ncbi:C-4 sterol methyl oxidase [Coemansia thaxteri]|nr:C-4 sterol methyl oxidase [Coemansia thaxteri]
MSASLSTIFEQFLAELNTTGNMTQVLPTDYTPTWAEQSWFGLFEGRSEAVVFGAIAFAVHQIVYYGRYLPYLDFYHYWAHRMFHHGLLYRRIHKVHHEHTAPFGIAAEYAHPIETAVLGQGTIAGPLLFNYFIEQVHITTMLVWIAARLWQTVEAHCGYDFPWSASHWLPFWAGASHHDYHHMAFVDNFASTFRWWDSIFGTDRRYQEYEARRIAAKTKTE